MKNAMTRRNKRSERDERTHRIHQKIGRIVVRFFVWLGIAVLYYIGFSFFFDTPVEHRMKQSMAQLRTEYDRLSARYDTLMAVLENVSERDRNLFRTLFESDPYDFSTLLESDSWQTRERLMGLTNRELGEEFSDKMRRFEERVEALHRTYTQLQERIGGSSELTDCIPSIQPVVNNELTLLTASFGLRIHPFYRSLTPHRGVDYTVPEGSRVFATADGVVKEITSKNTTSGLTVVLSHGNGYETTYCHLSKANVKKGDRVHRGDIIALTGNTGLSLSPHLHYEVRHDGLRDDPIHYFFMELSPKDYQRIMRIAQSGMQSFD